MKIKKLILSTAIVFTGLSSAGAEAAVDFADYYQYRTVGNYWTYQNVLDPADTYTQSVFESFIFQGQPAFKLGNPDRYNIISSDVSNMSVFAGVKEGVLYDFADVSFDTVTDGRIFSMDNPASPTMMRLWDNLDTSQTAVYNVPALTNLILFVGFDTNFPSNSQNSILFSNLGFPAPDYAVTDFQLWQPGIGLIIDFEVFAETGQISKRYNLVDYHIAPVPLPSALWLFGSTLVGFIGLGRKGRRA